MVKEEVIVKGRGRGEGRGGMRGRGGPGRGESTRGIVSAKTWVGGQW